tara:strand:- start:1688 stop:1900 length:213 start_codon:yes stop_codon:yes gene_type:complete
MPAKLKEVESSFKNNGEKTGVSNKVCQKVQKGAKRAATAEDKHAEVSNKVYQKVKQMAEIIKKSTSCIAS